MFHPNALTMAYHIKAAATRAAIIKSAASAPATSTLNPRLIEALKGSGISAAAVASMPILDNLYRAIQYALFDVPVKRPSKTVGDFFRENKYQSGGTILGGGIGAALAAPKKNVTSAVLGALLGGLTGSVMDRAGR